MLIALSRRRSLLVAVALVVAVAGVGAPEFAGLHGHCTGPVDLHCAAVLIPFEVATPSRAGWLEPGDLTTHARLVPLALLKIPLAA